ncbi:beta-1,3-galactosyltransferase 5-like [Amphibalanus amphitrite]|uniref:beta-1,3-galactosyltransferase 5-like n=1 Tax=Amphibalanus amphitrite TaxID=1232801 RepID=UPI001C91DD5C|nr:beta-1,3-galactosyltransferase 5-like [Amphibalanus amphitrite]
MAELEMVLASLWLEFRARSKTLHRNINKVLSTRVPRKLLYLVAGVSCILLFAVVGTDVREEQELEFSGTGQLYARPPVRSWWSVDGRACDCTCIPPTIGVPGEQPPADGPVLTRDYYEPGFKIPSGYLCADGGDGVQLVMMVQSRPSKAAVRRTLRRTWARPGIQRTDVVLAFLVARTNDSAVQESIEKEADIFGDIVQANFVDHYNNLTLKSLATLEWVDTFCPKAKFVLKADDDLFINFNNLMQFIEYHQDKRNIIYGNLVSSPKPERDPKSVFYVSEAIWDQPMFPRYMGGPMYLISTDAVCGIFQHLMKRPYLFIEDVAVTGIGAQGAGVGRRRAPEIYTYPVPSNNTCLFRALLGAHQIPTDDLVDIWRRVHDPDIACRKYSPTLWDHCIDVAEQAPLQDCIMALNTTAESA